MFMLVAVMLPFFVSFEYKAIRAREIVLFAMMVSFCVSFNLLCAHTILLHGGSAVVVLSGIALGPEAGFLTGALGRFICNFFDGHGPWTPWQMVSWGLIGFISGVVFVRYDLREKKDLKNNSSFITLIASVILFEVTGYLFVVFTGRDMADTKGIMLYIFGLAGLITGGQYSYGSIYIFSDIYNIWRHNEFCGTYNAKFIYKRYRDKPCRIEGTLYNGSAI